VRVCGWFEECFFGLTLMDGSGLVLMIPGGWGAFEP
jgi:hypothetical protein